MGLDLSASPSADVGHEGVLTTFYRYGEVPGRRKVKIIVGLTKSRSETQSDADAVAQEAVRLFREVGST